MKQKCYLFNNSHPNKLEIQQKTANNKRVNIYLFTFAAFSISIDVT